MSVLCCAPRVRLCCVCVLQAFSTNFQQECASPTGDVTLSADEETAYLGCGNANPPGVYAYTVATGALRSHVATGGNPHGIALSKDGSTMYMIDWGNNEIKAIAMSGADMTTSITSVAGDVRPDAQ